MCSFWQFFARVFQVALAARNRRQLDGDPAGAPIEADLVVNRVRFFERANGFGELALCGADDALRTDDECAVDPVVSPRVGRRQLLVEHLKTSEILAGFGLIDARVQFG